MDTVAINNNQVSHCKLLDATHTYKHKGLPTITYYKVKKVNSIVSKYVIWFWDTYRSKWTRSWCAPSVQLMTPIKKEEGIL